ncbi:hypothetical protein L9F63_015410, partial [Diploptera punctata]
NKTFGGEIHFEENKLNTNNKMSNYIIDIDIRWFMIAENFESVVDISNISIYQLIRLHQYIRTGTRLRHNKSKDLSSTKQVSKATVCASRKKINNTSDIRV